MWRAVIFFALVLGIVLSGLMLLRKTAGRPPAERPPPRLEKKDDDTDW
jgi:hypothetical protein